jgi:Mg-chelatase subunit ChlD
LTGEPVALTLELTGRCPERSPAIDIMLSIDRSGSMLGGKLDAAKAAAQTFLDAVDFGKAQVGLVAFSHESELLQPLTADVTAVRSAVDRLAAVGGTDIAGGLDLARAELNGPRRRPEAGQTIVLLTDGNSDPRSATIAAVEAKLAGGRIFVIGLGEDVNGALLQRIASGAGDYYPTPSGQDLARVYADIGRRIRADGLLRSVTVRAELADGLALLGMAEGPPPQVDGRRLTWALSGVPLDGLRLVVNARTLRPGRQPTLTGGDADYIDGLDRGGWARFGAPTILVLSPQRLPTPAPSATPRPARPVYLPVVQQGHCLVQVQHADVMLVLDTSHSMTEPTGQETKLAAAVAAAQLFVGLLRLPADQVGLVTFDGAARLAAPLGSAGETVRRALAEAVTGSGTRIDMGLERAAAELAGPGHRLTNRPVIVLLTDGRPSGTTDAEVVARATEARAAGIEVFAVGLGADVDPDLLTRLASGPDHVYLAGAGRDLEGIYRAIAGTIPCR